MANDRYDARGHSRDDRSRWSEDRFERSPRSGGGHDDRGFFERAGEEISSWFGGDRDEQDYRDRGRSYRERGSERGGWSSGLDNADDDHRGFLSKGSYRGSGGDSGPSGRWLGGGSGGRGSQDDRYRPMTGDYSRSERFRDEGGRFEGRAPSAGREGSWGGGGESNWERDDYRRTEFAGSRDRSSHPDPHYHEWRQRQISELDRDYDEYRREHQSKFESDFGGWREKRQSKRQLLGQAREHMEVVGSDGQHVGTVDKLAGDRIILTKSDPEAGGVHHSIACHHVDRIEDERVVLDFTADEARKRWRDEDGNRALFEGGRSGETGPHMLDRSFSGTYRD